MRWILARLQSAPKAAYHRYSAFGATPQTDQKASKIVSRKSEVVEISNPVVDGADLVYNYKFIEGDLPCGGATSLFINWIGVGSGPHRIG